MIGWICYWVINMSIVASFMGLIVMLIRKLRFIPHRVSVFLWIIPFLRMVVPVGINSPYSLMTLFSRFTTKTVTVYQPSDDLAFSLSNTIRAAESYSPLRYKASFLETVFNVTGFVWIIVALALIIALTIIYVSTKRAVADSIILKDNVYLSDKVDSPAVYGIFRPKIIMPEAYKEKETEYIIRHEKTHISASIICGGSLVSLLPQYTGSIRFPGSSSRHFLMILNLPVMRWLSQVMRLKTEKNMQERCLSVHRARACSYLHSAEQK